jgi:hypothetical protein
MPIKKVEIMPTGAEPRIIPSEPTRIDRTTPGSGGTPLTNSEPQEVNIGDPLADCEKQLMAVVYSAEPILENVRRIVEGFLKPGGKSRSDGELRNWVKSARSSTGQTGRWSDVLDEVVEVLDTIRTSKGR